MSFCENCGQRLNDSESFCPNCGARTKAARTAPAVYQAPVYSAQPAYVQNNYYAVPQYKHGANALAIVSMALFVASLPFYVYYVTAIGALIVCFACFIMSCIAVGKARSGDYRFPLKGLAVTGVVLTAIVLGVELLAVIAIVAFLVIGVLLLGSSSAGDLSSLFESVI